MPKYGSLRVKGRSQTNYRMWPINKSFLGKKCFNVNVVNVVNVAHTFAGPLNPGADSKDNAALRHFRNCNPTSESPKISTRRPQTPDKGIYPYRDTMYQVCPTGNTKNMYQLLFVLADYLVSFQGLDRKEPITCGLGIPICLTYNTSPDCVP